MSGVKAATRGVSIELQTAATATGNGRIIAIPNSFTQHRVNIKGNGAVGAGAIQIESAEAEDYSGTWSPIAGSPITVPADSELDVNFNGVYKFLRARISTLVTVGTVTVTYQGS
jgi:hypothetical protein